MLGRSVKSRITSELCEQFSVENNITYLQDWKRNKKFTKYCLNVAFVFYLFIATPLTSPSGTNGVICYYLSIFWTGREQDPTNRRAKFNKGNIRKVLHHQVSSFLLNVVSRNVLILSANIFHLQNALCKIHPNVTIDATLVSRLVSIIILLYWLQAIFF